MKALSSLPFALSLLACGGVQPSDIDRDARRATVVAARARQPPRQILGRDVPIDLSQLTPALPRVVADETLSIGRRGAQPRPSLAVDASGTTHVAFTLADPQKPGLKQLDSVGYGVRQGGTWKLTPAVASGWRALIDLDPSGAPQIWTFDESSNHAELRRLGTAGFAVVDRVHLAAVYQVLRDSGGVARAMLGDFGGNLYLLSPSSGGWSKTWVKRWGTDVRPPGVLLSGVASIFERTLLNHITSASTEALPGPKPGHRRPSGPLGDSAGRLHVLQDTATTWQNQILLQTRASNGSWSSKTLLADAAPPPSSSCPTQLGQPCELTAVSHTPLGLALVDDRPVPVLLRTTQQASYRRTCLQRDPNWPGSVPPCIDPGGPSGPWQSTPSKGAVDRLDLIVDGVAVALSGPLTNPAVAAVHGDTRGLVHVALYQADALRYVALKVR